MREMTFVCSLAAPSCHLVSSNHESKKFLFHDWKIGIMSALLSLEMVVRDCVSR